MRQVSRAAALAATIVLAGGIGFSTPATASSLATPSANTVECPNRATTTKGEFDYAMQHGTIVDRYTVTTPGSAYEVMHVVFQVGSYYEEFATDRLELGRLCFDRIPPRNHGKPPAERQRVDGGGYSSGGGDFYIHSPSPHLIARTTWVKWKVSVN